MQNLSSREIIFRSSIDVVQIDAKAFEEQGVDHGSTLERHGARSLEATLTQRQEHDTDYGSALEQPGNDIHNFGVIHVNAELMDHI